jgi:multidrug efflux pump subunit AcrB
LKSINGVSEVDVTGVPDRQVNIIVSKEALAQHGLTITGIISAIAASNVPLPAGYISMNGVNYNINFKGGITDPAQIQSVAVGDTNGAPIYLRDVALISDGLAPATSYSRLSVDGAPSNQAITLTVHKQSGASIEGTANAVREKLEQQGLTFLSAEVQKIPQNTVAVTDPDTILKIQKMLDLLEENDDVQNVFHNADLPEEDEEE